MIRYPILFTYFTIVAQCIGGVTINPLLPLGDINVLVLTDVHSWVAGQGRHIPGLNADYGDVLSFYERLKAYLDEQGKDLWLVNNGDFVHGTGISMSGDPSSLIPVIQKIPWDALNVGNHELYEDKVVEYMTRPGGMVDFFGDRYLTTNVNLYKKDLGESLPLGSVSRVLEGNNSNILVFGFLYDMEDASSMIQVVNVEKAVKSVWFKEILSAKKKEDSIDGILVLAHMDLKDPLLEVILKAIRNIMGDEMPVQFITGHTHYRGVAELDSMSTAVEAGRYLDTVGFVSFPKKGSSESSFNATFIDGSKEFLASKLGLGLGGDMKMGTENGMELSKFIRKTREKLHLLEEIGCAPNNFFLDTTLDNEQSLWGLYRDEVVPNMFFNRGYDGSVMILHKLSWRYDIFPGTVIVDDIIAVSPFNDTISYVGSFPGSAILQLNASLNTGHDPDFERLPDYILIGEVPPDKRVDLYAHDFHLEDMVKALNEILPQKTITPKKTDLTSTLLWLSFVDEFWACDGSGSLPDWVQDPPDWVPTPKSVAKKLGKEDDEGATRTITIIMSVFATITILLFCRGLWITMRYIFSGFTPLTEEELENFHFEEDKEMNRDIDYNDDAENDFIQDIEEDRFEDEDIDDNNDDASL